MNKLFSLIKRAPKRASAVVLMIAAAIIVPTALFAYGPTDRATFTYENPAPYVTFDSITDNPNVGDERNFVRIKDASDTNAYDENVNVQPGHTYQVMVFYHNNAATDLNASGAGIAKDVTLRMQMADSVAAGSSTNVTGFIDWAGPTTGEVWDSASLTNTSAGSMDLSFVAGSAKVTSNGKVNGMTLPDSVFSTGTNLGYDALDGVLPGCNQYSGYVIFQVKANQPNFSVQKQVSVDNGNTWSTNATTTPGSTILYRIIYTNTGTTKQTDVTVKDTLPTGITYVPGSTQIVNSVTNGQYQATSDGVTTTGLNIGAYAPNGNAALKFSAKVADATALACGTNTLDNVARVTTPNGYDEASADVVVNTTCAPNDCKPGIPVGDARCTTTPPELPHTGPTQTILGVLGIGAIVASLGYFLMSRRALKNNR